MYIASAPPWAGAFYISSPFAGLFFVLEQSHCFHFMAASQQHPQVPENCLEFCENSYGRGPRSLGSRSQGSDPPLGYTPGRGGGPRCGRTFRRERAAPWAACSPGGAARRAAFSGGVPRRGRAFRQARAAPWGGGHPPGGGAAGGFLRRRAGTRPRQKPWAASGTNGGPFRPRRPRRSGRGRQPRRLRTAARQAHQRARRGQPRAAGAGLWGRRRCASAGRLGLRRPNGSSMFVEKATHPAPGIPQVARGASGLFPGGHGLFGAAARQTAAFLPI